MCFSTLFLVCSIIIIPVVLVHCRCPEDARKIGWEICIPTLNLYYRSIFTGVRFYSHACSCVYHEMQKVKLLFVIDHGKVQKFKKKVQL